MSILHTEIVQPSSQESLGRPGRALDGSRPKPNQAEIEFYCHDGVTIIRCSLYEYLAFNLLASDSFKAFSYAEISDAVWGRQGIPRGNIYSLIQALRRRLHSAGFNLIFVRNQYGYSLRRKSELHLEPSRIRI